MPSPADAGAAAHVFTRDLAAPELDPDDRHHLERVLRLRAGDRITVADGTGTWRVCRFGDDLIVDGPVVRDERPEPLLTIGLALVKGERPELAVQKLTELGVDRIVLFRAERSVVRWDDDRQQRAQNRLASIARAAAMQSRRARLPEVRVGVPFPELAGLPGAALAQRGGGPLDLAHPTVLVGPEGGWAPSELASGLPTVGLSDAVLRAETAALTAAAGLSAMRREKPEKTSRAVTQGD
jgi:16S rRNA (uracil1498-N3)-methyltransferase